MFFPLPQYFSRGIRKLKSLRIYDKRHLYRLFELDHLTKIMRDFEIDCVFDIGANRGQYASMLRKHARFNGHIISIEPMPDAAAEILEKSREDTSWVVEQLAVDIDAGQQSFSIMAGDEFSSLRKPSAKQPEATLAGNKVVKEISVTTDTLENLFRKYQSKYNFKRPFLKLDTQGNDVNVVKSGDAIINQFVGMQSELAIVELYDESAPFFEALSYYEALGFSLSAFVPNNYGHFPQLLETDCIMINKRDL